MLAGCVAPPPAPPIPEGAPADFPLPEFGTLPDGALLFRVSPEGSTAYARVYRGGALARLGHDHVVSAEPPEGLLAVLPAEGGVSAVVGDFYAALGDLVVDDRRLRSALDFDTEPSDEDRDGTRRNMLAALNAAEHPWLRIRVDLTLPQTAGAASRRDSMPESTAGGEQSIPADVQVTLAGVSRGYRTDVVVRVDGQQVFGRGNLQILQSDFDIETFSVMGGALTVQDRIDLSFAIMAVRR
jgi:hypothetical protein